MFKETIYTTAIFNEIKDVVRRHILINAKAGSGKTTTIIRSLELIPHNEPTIFLAFNKAIADDIRAKIQPLNLNHVEVATLHSCGFRQIRKQYSNVTINKNKISKILMQAKLTWTDVLPEEIDSYCSRVERLVDMFRFAMPQSREHVLELCEKHEIELFNGEIERAKAILIASNSNTKEIDYMDMIYFPAHKDMRITKYKNVFVDECQDLNAAQHKLLEKLIDPNGGRLIAVGDPNQSIYGFAGADVDSFDRLRNLFPNTVELPLSFSYRCPIAVVEHAQQIVADILPAPNAKQGIVRSGSYKEIVSGDFILCRNTRPLVSLCMKFLSESKKATIKGADIGQQMVNMIKNTKTKTNEALFNRFQRDLDKLIEKMRKAYPHKDAEKMVQVVNLQDKIGALKAIAQECKTTNPQEVIDTIYSIFTDNVEGIVLSTMHKSKGLEAKNVFIIEPQLCPAPYAKQPWQQAQEQNLMYVARTRAKEQLIYVHDWTADETKKKNLTEKLISMNLINEETA